MVLVAERFKIYNRYQILCVDRVHNTQLNESK